MNKKLFKVLKKHELNTDKLIRELNYIFNNS